MGLFDRERLARLRQKQETAFTAMYLHRPPAILLTALIADVRWITPNGITLVSVVMRLAAAGLLWPEVWGRLENSVAVPVAIVLWHVGCVLDAVDGTLARYRRAASAFGRYLDKVTDRIVTLALILPLVARAYLETHDTIHFFLAIAYVATIGATSVAKWIEAGILAEHSAQKAEDEGETPAPERSAADWVRFVARSLPALIVPTELDLSLWFTIAWLTGRIDLLFWGLAGIGVPYALAALALRGWRVARLDRERTRR